MIGCGCGWALTTTAATGWFWATRTGWGATLENLERNFPEQAVFNTKTGGPVNARDLTKTLRYWAHRFSLFNNGLVEEKEHPTSQRKYISVHKTIKSQLTCRGIRRAVATHAVLDYKQRKIGFVGSSDSAERRQVPATKFLCSLATVMNTSIPVLLDHYVQCPIADLRNDYDAWQCVYMTHDHVVTRRADTDIVDDVDLSDDDIDQLVGDLDEFEG